MEGQTSVINVREVLRTKAPNAKVPEFLIRYLERIVHQEELNVFLQSQHGIEGVPFVVNSMKFLDVRAHSEGLDELPDGRYTFVSNHPLGGIDGLATAMEVYKRFPDKGFRFISNDLLSTLINLSPLFVPVNKVGNQSQHRTLPQRLTETYQSDVQMVIFPAGKCSRRIKGKVTEVRWQKSFIAKSIEARRDVVPVYFEGRNSNFFYNLANIRTVLGIKINVEMLYLVNEMFKQRGNDFHIRFGKPIPYTAFDKSRTQQEWADYVRDLALALRTK